MNHIPVSPRARRLAPVILLVLGIHAALLAAPVRSPRLHDGSGAGGPLQVRMVANAAVEVTTASPPAPASVQEVRTVPASALARALQPEAPVSEQALEPLTVLAPAAVTPPLEAFGLIMPGIDSDDDYFPRALLTAAPAPLEMVLIAYPAIEQDAGRYRSELTLFIDETGRVARVRVEGDQLPPALEQAARDAFTQARFRSGELDGRAVKSRIRVEVVFDSRAGNA